MWAAVLLAGALAMATKAAGYLVPARLLEDPRFARVAGVMTIGLLASLIAVNALADGQALRPDARLVALAVGVAGFAVRLPFIVVVVAGAVAAALARLAGLP